MAVTDVWADWSTSAGSNSPAGSATPEIDDEFRNIKAQCKANAVALSGNQTIAGVKTFSSTPSIPGYVATTGDQTVGGVKTFSSIPLCATDPTSGDHLVRKGFIDAGWSDYSGTSTVVGWGSTTVKVIKYKTVGKILHVLFRIEGTSNSTAASFTVPNNNATATTTIIHHRAQDSGNWKACGHGFINTADNVVRCCIDSACNETAWTATGDKVVSGQFFMEIA